MRINKPNGSKLYYFLFALVLILASCKVSYYSFRAEQRVVHADSATVTRVYIDRYGDLYPDTALRINARKFRLTGFRSNSNIGSLSNYFLSDKKRMAVVVRYYGVKPDSTQAATYKKVQQRILDRMVAEICAKVSRQHAKRIIYLVHGFNDTIAEKEYLVLRDSIVHTHISPDKKPVYIDIHWDGLNAHCFDGPKAVKVWKPALLNSLFASITLRELMTGIESRIKTPSIIITHSLGAGVAFGALFNTEHKWHSVDMFSSKAYKTRAEAIIDAPMPITRVKIGVLAPAIPAENTFIDFNNRKPSAISPAQNNISTVIIGYNYKDYGVSKRIFGINFSPIYYSTTLGCNFTFAGKSAIDRVKDEMKTLGYGEDSKIIQSLEFQTPFRKDPPIIEEGTREHAFAAYIADVRMRDFLEELFKD